jgi:hypothetical protein
MFRIPLLLAAATSISSGAVIYSESFDTDASGVQAIGAKGWEGKRSTPPAVVGDPPGITDTVHNSGTYRAGTVGGANGALDDYLFAQTQNGTVKEDFFLYTTTVTAFAPNNYTSLTATWSRNGETVDAYHLAVKVGDNWYVSQTSYTGSAPGQGATPVLNLLTTSWSNVLTTGTLQIGTETSTYSSLFGSGAEISGIGFYIDGLSVSGSANRTIRLDNIVIDAVPEPSAAALSILGLAALMGRRKR